MSFERNKINWSTVRVLLTWAVLLSSLIFSSCRKKKVMTVKQTINLDTVYTMCTKDVHTFITDSGYTRTRLDTKEWRLYDRENNKKWFFPYGILLQRYDDNNKKVIARISADTAYNYFDRELWELRGHVHIRNVSGTDFYAPRMFWDVKNGEIYSDDSVYIHTPDQILRGESFRANQDMSKYTFQSTSAIVDFVEKDSVDTH